MTYKTSSLFSMLIMILLASLILTACAETTVDAQAPNAANHTQLAKVVAHTLTAYPSSTALPPTSTLSPAPPSPTASQPPSPTSVSTPAWVFHEAGEVTAPILLYHHVDGDESENRYHVSVADFRAQMQALHDWGYTTIPISRLIQAITQGAELPPRPVVITFDDGHSSIYENAFPIMQEFGFTGVFYIVSNRLKAKDFVNVDQLREMLAAGWEVGSHSQSHIDLPANHTEAADEIRQSKLDLEAALGITNLQTLAYPFGTLDSYVADKVYAAGYAAAVGLGKGWKHDRQHIFYLERIEIHGDYSLEDVAARLPWGGGE